MDNKIKDKIKFELSQIEELFSAYSDLFNKVQSAEPSLIERTAAASIIHSFYNGIENIFIVIAKQKDKQFPKDENWHRKIIIQMSKDISSRPAVISKESTGKLKGYLSFRHYYRHSYSFKLNWDELKPLLFGLYETWQCIKNDINEFLKKL